MAGASAVRLPCFIYEGWLLAAGVDNYDGWRMAVGG